MSTFLGMMPGHRALRPFFEQVNHDPMTAITIISTGVQIAGTIGQGNAARAMANNQAVQLNQQAGQERATAQRKAINSKMAGAYAISRARALQAGNGGDPDSVTSIDNEEKLAGNSEYNALTDMYNGEQRARGLNMQADDVRIEGQQRRDAAITSAFSQGTKTLTSMNGSTLFSKYSDPFNPYGLDGGASDTTGDEGQ